MDITRPEGSGRGFGWLKELGWVAAFLAVLGVFLFPTIIVSAAQGHVISIWEQVILIMVATLTIQLLRRKNVFEVIGRPSGWAPGLAIGIGLGGLLMALPALFLMLTKSVTFAAAETAEGAIFQTVLLMAGVAVAEELLFRGVLFQRLVAALGVWPAQLILAALFVLTHLGNPGMEGATKAWAAANIFLASMMFGFAYLRTRSLALPIGMHFMANIMQGTLLGFGVSGTEQATLLRPTLSGGADWLTGGQFGLEASPPGLIAVVAMLLLLATVRLPLLSKSPTTLSD